MTWASSCRWCRPSPFLHFLPPLQAATHSHGNALNLVIIKSSIISDITIKSISVWYPPFVVHSAIFWPHCDLQFSYPTVLHSSIPPLLPQSSLLPVVLHCNHSVAYALKSLPTCFLPTAPLEFITLFKIQFLVLPLHIQDTYPSNVLGQRKPQDLIYFPLFFFLSPLSPPNFLS